MSRYIDAEALLEEIQEELDFKTTMYTYEQNKCINIGLKIAQRDIKSQPTADVVEVRHGEWKKLYDKAPRYVCTACNHLYNNREYKFCPNCGAKMDGERRSENEG